MDNLNPLELSLLQGLAKKYPTIGLHIPFLKVKSRVFTGVGMYVNFEYAEGNQTLPILELQNSTIGNNEIIEIPGLEFGLGYEVDITDSKINFIEFITYGEAWDGDTSTFKLVPNDFWG